MKSDIYRIINLVKLNSKSLKKRRDRCQGRTEEVNGYLDLSDVSEDWKIANGYTDPLTLEQFEQWFTEVRAIKYEEVWIFGIADMVISGQTVINDGTKNFQLRFCPVSTTTFEADR